MKIKLFIVDDHYMVIEGIYSLLQHESNIDWMGHATNAASCLAFLKLQQPDVLLMDISLPDVNGTELCKQVNTLYPAICILGLSTFNQQPVIRNMMDNGALGYLLKNATKEEILKAISEVMNGKNYFSKEAELSLRNKEAGVPVITRRESEVLSLIAEGFTNSEIAEKLFISIPTINTHRKSLLEKFEVKNTATLIGKAIKLGLI
ncbi:MAG: response regulator transcription factor [Bacteroidetes bacterium]|nr:response regulator transcription factor [Bacteroidota bacterium]MBS1755788.1 response regulator transcription factor [Bacteroidota bacterium]